MYGNRNQSVNPTLNTNTAPSLAVTSNRIINYTITPTPAPVLARFEGISARCGKCNHKLGEFKSVSGEIQCPKSSCKTKNIIVK